MTTVSAASTTCERRAARKDARRGSAASERWRKSRAQEARTEGDVCVIIVVVIILCGDNNVREVWE